MHFDTDEDDRRPFDTFRAAELGDDGVVLDDFEIAQGLAHLPAVEPQHEAPAMGGFSWAGFAGGLAALMWIVGAIGGPLSFFGAEAVMALDPAMQVGLIGLAFGPALLFWVSASAAGEALKARRLTAELARMAQRAQLPGQAAEGHAQHLANSVRAEIEALNDAVAAALGRLSELERSAQHNAALFTDAISASRENGEAVSNALRAERDAIAELNGDLKGQADAMANSIGRQIRLMREASKLVKAEIAAAEDALEAHLSAFASSASVMGERTATFHEAADKAAATSAQLNSTMADMLDGLSEATRLTETARKSTEQAVVAANETAGAVRETTRAAVHEARRAAQLIRAETAAIQEAANDAMGRLHGDAGAARLASYRSEGGADHYKIDKRLAAPPSAPSAKKITAHRACERVIELKSEPPVMVQEIVREEVTTLHAAANAAASRGRVHVAARAEIAEAQPRRMFGGFGGWQGFLLHLQRDEPLVAANETSLQLADFSSPPPLDPDADMKSRALDLMDKAGVNLGDVLPAIDLDRIARASRDGAAARRGAVLDAAPGAVSRIARHLKRNEDAHDLAIRFRARPDLAKSGDKDQGSDLVRAYLLIDAALA